MKYTENMENSLFELIAEEDEIDSEKVLEFINRPESFRSFGEGLTEIIAKKYGEVDGKKLLATLAKEKDIHINRNTLNNWFEGNRPKKGEQSREHMFLIAFALSLNLQETQDLFQKVYLDRPFNLRDGKEFIYFYCIKEGLTYRHAQMMISELNLESECNIEETVLTCLLENDLIMLESDAEVIDYIQKHPNNFQKHTVSARNTLEYLLENVKATNKDKEKIRMGKVDETCSYTAREYWKFSYLENNKCNSYVLDKNKDISSISSMLTIIEGGDLVKTRNEQKKSVFRNANLPQEIKNRFPTKHTFTSVDPTFEELRKMVILLYSYILWFKIQYENENLDLDEYIERMNDILYDSGLQTLYYGNPYDWLFLYCTLSEMPLDVFRGIMTDAVWNK